MGGEQLCSQVDGLVHEGVTSPHVLEGGRRAGESGKVIRAAQPRSLVLLRSLGSILMALRSHGKDLS